MKNFIVINSKIKSFKKKITVSGDKSLSIRAVLLASQAIGKSRISNLLESEDVLNSLKVIKKLGSNFKKKNNLYEIDGYGLDSFYLKKRLKIYAGNSGTLARLILGLLANVNQEVKIYGDKSLSKRDFSRISNPLKDFGVNINLLNNSLPATIIGTKYLRPINYFENLGSAQCKSAVMLAALKTNGVTKIKAKKSRNHTELLFQNLNIPIKLKKNKKFDFIEIRGPSNFSAFDYNIPGDISSSAFFIVLTLLSKNSSILIKNININPSRMGIIKILNKMNANITLKNKKVYKGEAIADIFVKSKSNIKSIKCPEYMNSSAIDEFLIIFLVAAKAKGISTFKNLGELNKKESPRLDIGINFLKKIGIKVLRKKNDIQIHGNPKLKLEDEFVMKDFLKDHRVFMMSSVAALTLGGRWKIYDRESIKTSFPNFIKIIKKLGAKIN